jgi:serine/threonine protein kinase
MSSFPEAIGRYRIEGVLGRGAMGIVYKAHDPEIDRTVAVKLVRADLLDGEDRENYIRRFRNEARIAGRFVHPNIVGVFDIALHDGNPFIIMEYVEGLPLGKVFPRGEPVRSSEVARIALQVLEALEYAHGFGVVHRDIKPGNVLLMANAKLKVADFGISRIVSSELTIDPVMIGTPSYMSPEQCRGDPVDGRCDVFSLGCVLYELLAGERPFAGRDYNGTIHRLLHETHEPLAGRCSDGDRPLALAIDRALAKLPDERFATAQDMAAAIQAARAPADARAAAPSDALPVVDPAAWDRSASGQLEGSGVAGLDTMSLMTIERRLAHHVGPVARMHLRRAMGEARTLEEFCRLLGQEITDQASRAAFVDGALAAVAKAQPAASSPVPAPSSTIAEADVARITRALAGVMGPIAGRLVRRAQVRAATRDELCAACEDYIIDARDRAAFRSAIQQRS